MATGQTPVYALGSCIYPMNDEYQSDYTSRPNIGDYIIFNDDSTNKNNCPVIERLQIQADTSLDTFGGWHGSFDAQSYDADGTTLKVQVEGVYPFTGSNMMNILQFDSKMRWLHTGDQAGTRSYEPLVFIQRYLNQFPCNVCGSFIGVDGSSHGITLPEGWSYNVGFLINCLVEKYSSEYDAGGKALHFQFSLTECDFT